METVALLSGGKDSCFAMMHSMANGYRIVAIATLLPSPGVDELDSYMYQSVGVRLLPLIARALGVPLYERVITGKPVSVGGVYGSREGREGREGREEADGEGEGEGVEGDETEDLVELLSQVKRAHPNLTHLSSGAILSTYQRTRIEHVLSRPSISLTPLSFLWQQPERPLVRSMILSGLNPVVVKVAGLGLRVEDVGQPLANLAQEGGRLERLERQWGCHFAGEGGEYETVCLDGPGWGGKVEITSSRTILTDPSPVAHLQIDEGGARLVPKHEFVRLDGEGMRRCLDFPAQGSGRGLGSGRGVEGIQDEIEDDEGYENDEEENEEEEEELLHLNLFDKCSRRLISDLRRSGVEEGEGEGDGSLGDGSLGEKMARMSVVDDQANPTRSPRLDRDDSLGDPTGPTHPDPTTDRTGLNRSGRWFGAIVELKRERGEEIGVLMNRHFKALHDTLRQNKLRLTQVQHINLYLSCMADFPLVNAQYMRWFGSEPPSRACVAVPMTAGTGDAASGDAGLRNVGQGNVCRLEATGWDDSGSERNRRTGLHVQGLSYWAPANVGPYSQGIIADNRLTIAGQIPLIPSTLTLASPPNIINDAVLSLQHFRRIVDVMSDARKGGAGWKGKGWIEGVIAWYVGDGQIERAVRAVWNGFAARQREGTHIPILFVGTTELPKGANVEWQVVHHTGQPSWPAVASSTAEDDESDDEEEENRPLSPSFETGDGWRRCESVKGDSTFSIHNFTSLDSFMTSLKSAGQKLRSDIQIANSVRLFYNHTVPYSSVSQIIDHIESSTSAFVSRIPTTMLTDTEGKTVQYSLVLVGSGRK